MPNNMPDNYWSLLGAIIIRMISGIISISQRIVAGQRATIIWVMSEFMAAILCGYLMFDAYYSMAHFLPPWATQPVLVAVSAHVGGRGFQMLEEYFYDRFPFIKKSLPPPDSK